MNDDVVRDTARALAATYDTASKGIIYEHQPSSPSAVRLARELKPLLEGKDGRGPVANERDLVEVLRRVERAATEARKAIEGNAHAYLDLLGRLMRSSSGAAGRSDPTAPGGAVRPSALGDHSVRVGVCSCRVRPLPGATGSHPTRV